MWQQTERMRYCVSSIRLFLLEYPAERVHSWISHYFLWPHRLSVCTLLPSLYYLLPLILPSLAFFVIKCHYGNTLIILVDCGVQLNIAERWDLLPHCFRSHHCSSGLSTVGNIWYHTVLQPPSSNMRNMLMFATPAVSFFPKFAFQ